MRRPEATPISVTSAVFRPASAQPAHQRAHWAGGTRAEPAFGLFARFPGGTVFSYSNVATAICGNSQVRNQPALVTPKMEVPEWQFLTFRVASSPVPSADRAPLGTLRL